ncbi:MAG: YbaK/EbsC family protein [Gemmatimonadota bacterium]|nr:YbaK/EbsC family protein [Gemmatimonadota bacterium]
MARLETAVTRFLDEAGVSYVVKPHAREVFTCEDAARERGVRLSQIVKCMIGCGPDGTDEKNLYVMLVPGDRRLKIKKVRNLAGGIRIDLVPPDRIAERLGLTVGAISPTQLAGKARFYMDRTLFSDQFVDISSGDPGAGVELSPQDLQAILGAEVCDIISTRN